MSIVLNNYQGTSFSQGIISEISVKNSTKTSVISLPGVDKDVIQKFGKRIREFTLSGIVTGSTGVSFLEGANNYTGSFYFSSSAMNQVLISTTLVFFNDLQWKDSGNRPMERKFQIELLEIL